MTIDVAQDYEKQATFKSNGTETCAEYDTCLNVYRDGDWITFNVLLQEVPKEYKVTLNNESQFAFTFGKAATTPLPKQLRRSQYLHKVQRQNSR